MKMTMKYSKNYYDFYQKLPEKLASHYPNLRLDNHCYLRIGLDAIFKTKWDTVIAKPAYKHLSEEKRKELLLLFNSYLNDKELLLAHNRQSLVYRKAQKSKTLFSV
jgi:hypothetical protein